MPDTPVIQHRALGPLGAEVSGIDLREPLDPATFNALRALLLEKELLLFRDQALGDREFGNFARRFGPLDPHTLTQFATADCPEILTISNRQQDGRAMGLVEVGHFWHSDGSYLPALDMYTSLYGVEVPRADDGSPLGDTLFTSATAAYAGLTPSMQSRIAGLHATFSYDYRYQKRIAINKTVRAARATGERRKDQRHPVVWQHPITGKKAILVNEGYVTRIDDLPEAEGRALLDDLLAHLYSDQYRYSHKWNVGDLLIWDNNSTQHNAVSNYGIGQPRLMKRLSIKTEWPQQARAVGAAA